MIHFSTSQLGVKNYEVTGVQRTVVYQTFETCPGVEDIGKAAHYAHGYICKGSLGGNSGCNSRFEGFSEREKNQMNEGTEFFYEQSDDGTGRCFIIWNVDHCGAISPIKGAPEMNILRKISESCEVQANIPATEPLSMEGDCFTAYPDYVIELNGEIYIEEETKANIYSEGCPIFKQDDKWKVRRVAWKVRRVSFDAFEYSAPWHGLPVGVKVKATQSSDKRFTVQETLGRGRIIYTIRLADEDKVTEPVLSASNTCEMVEVTCLGWSIDAITGNNVASCKCRSPTRTSCTATLLNMEADPIVTVAASNPAILCHIPVEGKELFYKGQHVVNVGKREKGIFKLSDADIVSQGTSWKGMLFGPLMQLEKWIQRIIPYLVLFLVVWAFPGIFATPAGAALLIGFFLAKQVLGVNASDVDLEECTYLIIGASSAITLLPWWVAGLVLTIQAYRFNRKTTLKLTHLILIAWSYMHREFDLEEIVDGNYESLYTIVLVILWYYLNTNYFKFNYYIARLEAYVRQVHEFFATGSFRATISNKFRKVAVIGGIVKLPDYTIWKNNFFKFIRCLIAPGMIVKKNMRITRSNMQVIMGPLQIRKKRKCPPRRMLRNVNNMKGTVFYVQEFNAIKNQLQVLSSAEINELYEKGRLSTNRQIWDLSWFKDLEGDHIKKLHVPDIHY